jgi:lipopolysaccharide assembly outer membrane protein LptD (OstA)
MSGRPIEALRSGALSVGETILSLNKDKQPFEKFLTVVYDDKCEVHTATDLEDYRNHINAVKVRGCTDFKKVFVCL